MTRSDETARTGLRTGCGCFHADLNVEPRISTPIVNKYHCIRSAERISLLITLVSNIDRYSCFNPHLRTTAYVRWSYAPARWAQRPADKMLRIDGSSRYWALRVEHPYSQNCIMPAVAQICEILTRHFRSGCSDPWQYRRANELASQIPPHTAMGPHA